MRGASSCGERNAPRLVDKGGPVAITVEQNAELRTCRDDRLLAVVRPGVGRFGMDASEVLAPFAVDLGDDAPKAFEHLGQTVRARAVHGIDDNAGTCGRDGAAIHQEGEVGEVRPHEVRLDIAAAHLGGHVWDELLHLVEKVMRRGPAIAHAHEESPRTRMSVRLR